MNNEGIYEVGLYAGYGKIQEKCQEDGPKDLGGVGACGDGGAGGSRGGLRMWEVPEEEQFVWEAGIGFSNQSVLRKIL